MQNVQYADSAVQHVYLLGGRGSQEWREGSTDCACVRVTDEAWQPMGKDEGELLAVRAGKVLLDWPATSD